MHTPNNIVQILQEITMGKLSLAYQRELLASSKLRPQLAITMQEALDMEWKMGDFYLKEKLYRESGNEVRANAAKSLFDKTVEKYKQATVRKIQADQPASAIRDQIDEDYFYLNEFIKNYTGLIDQCCAVHGVENIISRSKMSNSRQV